MHLKRSWPAVSHLQEENAINFQSIFQPLHLHLQVKIVTQYIEVLQLKVHANCGLII